MSGLVESEKLQNKQVSRDFHPRSEYGHNGSCTHFGQNSSQGPSPMFEARNWSRGNKWPRNWSRSGPNNHNFARQPDRRNFNERPVELQNSSFRSQQQENVNRSSLVPQLDL